VGCSSYPAYLALSLLFFFLHPLPLEFSAVSSLHCTIYRPGILSSRRVLVLTAIALVELAHKVDTSIRFDQAVETCSELELHKPFIECKLRLLKLGKG
jgi:hypothetical protein